jgi:hypothetical protein
VKVALRKKNDKFETVFYDTDKKEIKDVPVEDLIVKRMTVTALVECTGVWVSSVGCGLTWKAKQVKVVSRPDGVGRGYGFVDDDEDAPAARSGAKPAAAAAKATFANAFDDEEEDAGVDDEEVLKPAAAPVAAPEEHEPAALPKKVVKKVVAKKA